VGSVGVVLDSPRLGDDLGLEQRGEALGAHPRDQLGLGLGQQLLQPGVLGLRLAQPRGLTDPHATVLAR